MVTKEIRTKCKTAVMTAIVDLHQDGPLRIHCRCQREGRVWKENERKYGSRKGEERQRLTEGRRTRRGEKRTSSKYRFHGTNRNTTSSGSIAAAAHTHSSIAAVHCYIVLVLLLFNAGGGRLVLLFCSVRVRRQDRPYMPGPGRQCGNESKPVKRCVTCFLSLSSLFVRERELYLIPSASEGRNCYGD